MITIPLTLSNEVVYRIDPKKKPEKAKAKAKVYYIYGDMGTGKTTLGIALVHGLVQQHPTKKICMVERNDRSYALAAKHIRHLQCDFDYLILVQEAMTSGAETYPLFDGTKLHFIRLSTGDVTSKK
jgi:DNA polymerase III delta prime subunit